MVYILRLKPVVVVVVVMCACVCVQLGSMHYPHLNSTSPTTSYLPLPRIYHPLQLCRLCSLSSALKSPSIQSWWPRSVRWLPYCLLGLSTPWHFQGIGLWVYPPLEVPHKHPLIMVFQGSCTPPVPQYCYFFQHGFKKSNYISRRIFFFPFGVGWGGLEKKYLFLPSNFFSLR